MTRHIPKLSVWIHYHGMTLEEFAKAAGCSVRTLYNINSRTKLPSGPLAMRIEELTDGMYKMQYWFAETEENENV